MGAKTWKRGDAPAPSVTLQAAATAPCSTSSSRPTSAAAAPLQQQQPKEPHLHAKHPVLHLKRPLHAAHPQQPPALHRSENLHRGELLHGPPLGKRAKLAIDNTAANAALLADKLKQKEQELEMLRRKLAEQERVMKQQQEEKEAQEAARRESEQRQREQQRKREALNKAFASVADARSAPGAAGSRAGSAGGAGGSDGGGGEGGGGGQAARVADEEEVQRVLNSGDDYSCLQLHMGAGLAQVRRSYRQLAISLHPDKCRMEGAAAAFQRVNEAYKNLIKRLGG